MNKEELIARLEVMRRNLHDKLSYINAQHDVLVNQLAEVNNILSMVREDPEDA